MITLVIGMIVLVFFNYIVSRVIRTIDERYRIIDVINNTSDYDLFKRYKNIGFWQHFYKSYKQEYYEIYGLTKNEIFDT